MYTCAVRGLRWCPCTTEPRRSCLTYWQPWRSRMPTHGQKQLHLTDCRCVQLRVEDMWGCFVAAPCKLPDMAELWPLPGVQEEEVRNRASEVYNVTKLSLEARVRDLEGQVEQQHKVRVLRQAIGAGGNGGTACLLDWTCFARPV